MRILNTAFFRLPSLAAAVILTVCPRPFFLAVTIPLLFTVAHFFFEELHFTFLFVALEGETDTLSFRFLPALRAVFEALIFIFFTLIFYFCIFLIFILFWGLKSPNSSGGLVPSLYQNTNFGWAVSYKHCCKWVCFLLTPSLLIAILNAPICATISHILFALVIPVYNSSLVNSEYEPKSIPNITWSNCDPCDLWTVIAYPSSMLFTWVPSTYTSPIPN